MLVIWPAQFAVLPAATLMDALFTVMALLKVFDAVMYKTAG